MLGKALKRTAIIIDGSNLYATTKALHFEIDYRKMLAHYRRTTDLLRVMYYTAVTADEEFSSLRPLVDWLSYNGFTVITKDTKSYVNADGIRKIKGNMDVEMVVDAVELAPFIDHLIVFTGDGDFRYMVEVVQRKGVFVEVISTIATNPSMIADELRRQADLFTDLTAMREILGRGEVNGDLPRTRER